MKKKKTMGRPASISEFFRRRYPKDYPKADKLIEDELINLGIAQQIYDIRQKAGLTQVQLAALVSTSPSVISRLEDADYGGHSLSMLKRIAWALDKTIELRFVDKKKKIRHA